MSHGSGTAAAERRTSPPPARPALRAWPALRSLPPPPAYHGREHEEGRVGAEGRRQLAGLRGGQQVVTPLRQQALRGAGRGAGGACSSSSQGRRGTLGSPFRPAPHHRHLQAVPRKSRPGRVAHCPVAAPSPGPPPASHPRPQAPPPPIPPRPRRRGRCGSQEPCTFRTQNNRFMNNARQRTL